MVALVAPGMDGLLLMAALVLTEQPLGHERGQQEDSQKSLVEHFHSCIVGSTV